MIGKNRSFSAKKKMHKIVPKILARSKDISKGQGYNEKVAKRTAYSKGLGAKSGGGSNLNSKKLNESKFLRKVSGMAMTKADKKKLEKKMKRVQERSMVVDSDESLDLPHLSDEDK